MQMVPLPHNLSGMIKYVYQYTDFSSFSLDTTSLIDVNSVYAIICLAVQIEKQSNFMAHVTIHVHSLLQIAQNQYVFL